MTVVSTQRDSSLGRLWPIALALYAFMQAPTALADDADRIASRFNEPLERIPLTLEEQAWLEEHPDIRFRIANDSPPISWIEDNKFHGLALEYMKLLSRKIGFRLEYIPTQQWSDTVAAMDNREVDLVTHWVASKYDEKEIASRRSGNSLPAYYESIRVIFTNEQFRFVGAPRDLAGARLVWVRNGYVSPEFAELEPLIEKVYVGGMMEGLQAVSDGRADAMIANYTNGYFQLRKYGIKNVVISAPTGWKNYGIGLGIRSDWPLFYEMMLRAWQSITPVEHERIRMAWMHYDAPATINVATVYHGLIAIGVIGGVLFCFSMWLWNSRLRAEVGLREAAEKNALKARREAERASAAKSQFLARVCHELRTPLNAILGFSEIVQKEMFGPVKNSKYRGYIHDIHSSGQHLLGLVNDILDIARIEQNAVTMSYSRFSLPETIHWVCDMVDANAATAGVSLTYEIDPTVMFMESSEQSVRQILLNLLSNAIKFTPEGGEVALLAQRLPGNRLKLVVSDTGIGIPAVDLDRITKPFTQLEGALNPKHQGVGLGLAIVKGLCHKLGGQLDIHSRELHGTIVTIILPIGVEEQRQVA